MATTIKWIDNNAIETAHRIYKSATYFTKDNLPAPLVELGHDITEYVDSAGVDGENWYIVSALLNGYEVFSEPFIGGLQLPTGAGPTAFIGGDTTDGFYGEVPITDLISGDALATEIGLTAGTSQHSSEPWLKFSIDGKTIFVAKKPYRHSISWDAINTANAVYGGANAPIVTIGGSNYKVRLMTGAEADPTAWTTTSTADDNFGAGSEWNRLMYRVHTDVPTGGTTTNHGGAQVGGNWASYTDADLIVSDGDGQYTWTQETYASDASSRVYRGRASVSHFYAGPSDHSSVSFGWRPVLELVQ